MSDFDGAIVSIDDVRTGHASDLLAEADVVIAVDASTHEEEVVHGRHDWELATETGHRDDLVVLRVELDADSGDLEWLVDAIEHGPGLEHGDELESNEEDDV